MKRHWANKDLVHDIYSVFTPEKAGNAVLLLKGQGDKIPNILPNCEHFPYKLLTPTRYH